MAQSLVQLVLHYDGAGFAGWQRQAAARTVQGVLEESLSRLCNVATTVTGAGRTDSGVHARGQAASASIPEKWTSTELRRALNAVLPSDIWVAAAFDMHPEFHPRFSAISRSYSYHIGIDEGSRSPFRSRYEWRVERVLNVEKLTQLAKVLPGEKSFRAFAVQGTAPAEDDHVCIVSRASWTRTATELVFEIEANRFLHHMVRFLVGTMVDIASGKRPMTLLDEMLVAADNSDVSPPAPACGLFLEKVLYPQHLYVNGG